MHKSQILDFTNVLNEEQPFNYFSIASVLQNGLDDKLLKWLELTDNWEFTETDFYTQYEFSLLHVDVPENIRVLLHEQTISDIVDEFAKVQPEISLELVGLTVHKLLDGYKMGVHNDYIGSEESHRFLIQINAGWKEENGGYLMLFNSMNSDDVTNIISPLNNTGFGFEISPKSFHAVSTVYDFFRYTLVYTFKNIK
jgi:Rps23 Pro-64 3,4-dihydroxylase Tpa1-like proline 4-hydroxylase